MKNSVNINGCKVKLKERKVKLDAASIITWIFVGIYSLSILYIIYFMIQTAFKHVYDFYLDSNVFGLPNWSKYPFKLEELAFVDAWEGMKIQIRGNNYADIPTQFIYGLLYAVGSAFAGVFAKAFTAYFCAKYDTFFGKILYTVVVVTMILPVVGTMAATISIMKALSMDNNILGIIYYNAGFYGVYFLVLHATFKSIPNAYGESAQIDGAGHFSVFFKIYLPMVLPSMFAVGIMQFISFWNDYQTPMVYMPKRPTIAYGLHKYLISPKGDNAPAVLSASMIVCIPTVVLFCIFKNKIMGNISAGGLKG